MSSPLLKSILCSKLPHNKSLNFLQGPSQIVPCIPQHVQFLAPPFHTAMSRHVELLTFLCMLLSLSYLVFQIYVNYLNTEWLKIAMIYYLPWFCVMARFSANFA